MARHDEGAYSREICDREATKPASLPRRKTARNILQTRSNKMPRVFIKTYGCQMNERDSEAVAAQLVAKGYTLVPSEETADVVLLNTCSVRDLAEQKALNKMKSLSGEAGKLARKPVFGFMGCMAQSR